METGWSERKPIQCHLCFQHDAQEQIGGGLSHSVECASCGEYEITPDAWLYRFNKDMTPLTYDEREVLAKWVKTTWAETKKRVTLTTPKIDEIIGRKPPEPKISIY